MLKLLQRAFEKPQRSEQAAKEDAVKTDRVNYKMIARNVVPTGVINDLDVLVNALQVAWPSEQVDIEIGATLDLVEELGETPRAIALGQEILNIVAEREDA